MSKVDMPDMPYSPLRWQYVAQEHPTIKCKYFFLGFLTALVLTLFSSTAFQLYMSSNNVVTVSSGQLTQRWAAPPPHEEVAKVARYVVHISEWASIATISTAEPIKSYPFGNIISISDGPVNKASGTIYAYITRMDLSGKDLMKDGRATLSLSEAQSDYCQKHELDPEDPQCARILLTGTVVEVKNGTRESEFAKTALFSRHPAMKYWPAGHRWLFVKLNIEHIYVLDFYGGASEVDVEEYYNAEL